MSLEFEAGLLGGFDSKVFCKQQVDDSLKRLKRNARVIIEKEMATRKRVRIEGRSGQFAPSLKPVRANERVLTSAEGMDGNINDRFSGLLGEEAEIVSYDRLDCFAENSVSKHVRGNSAQVGKKLPKLVAWELMECQRGRGYLDWRAQCRDQKPDANRGAHRVERCANFVSNSCPEALPKQQDLLKWHLRYR